MPEVKRHFMFVIVIVIVIVIVSSNDNDNGNDGSPHEISIKGFIIEYCSAWRVPKRIIT